MEAKTAPSKGIFDSANLEARQQVVELLHEAYWMEIETVMSYIAASVNLDGVRAQEIKESLAEDVEEELGHAKQFAERIKELYGVVPGSEDFEAEQSFRRPLIVDAAEFARRTGTEPADEVETFALDPLVA